MELKDLVRILNNIDVNLSNNNGKAGMIDLRNGENHDSNRFKNKSNVSTNCGDTQPEIDRSLKNIDNRKLPTELETTKRPSFMVNLLNNEKTWIGVLAVIDDSIENSYLHKNLLDTLFVQSFLSSSNMAKIDISIGWFFDSIELEVKEIDNETNSLLFLSPTILKKFCINFSYQDKVPYLKQSLNKITEERPPSLHLFLEYELSNGHEFNNGDFIQLNNNNPCEQIIDKLIKFELISENPSNKLQLEIKNYGDQKFFLNESLKLYTNWEAAFNERIMTYDQPFEDLLICSIEWATGDENNEQKSLLVKFLPSDFYLILPIKLTQLIVKHFWQFVNN